MKSIISKLKKTRNTKPKDKHKNANASKKHKSTGGSGK